MTVSSALKNSVTPTAPIAVAQVDVANPQVLKDQIARVSSERLKKLLTDQATFQSEVDRLSSLRGHEDDLKMVQSSLANVRAELAKRGEDLASMAAAIAAHAESFGQHSVEAFKDTPADIQKRDGANAAVRSATEEIGFKKAHLATLDLTDENSASAKELVLLEQAKTDAGADWKIWARSGNVDAAEAAITAFQDKNVLDIATAEAAIATAETALESANQNIAVVEEQIEIDKRDRVRNSSLEVTYQFIASLCSDSIKVLDVDSKDLGVAVTRTNESLNGAINRRAEVSQKMRDATKALAEKDVMLQSRQSDLADYTDRTSPEYQKVSVEIEALSSEIDILKSEVLLLEGDFSNMDVAVKENQASIRGMTMQKRLAERQLNKFRAIERTARDIGQNLVLMVKGMAREGINESLDKGTNQMTVAVFRMARQVQISSARQISDMAERRLDVLHELEAIDASADTVLAGEVTRYAALAQEMRDGYAAQGLDVENMSNLAAAAAMIAPKAANEDKVDKEKDYY